MVSTAELTEKYISEHPSVKDCLKNNVINYSKLSRKISKELGIEKESSVEAVLVACRRFSLKLKHEKPLEEKIIKILKKTELEIKNKIVVFIVQKKVFGDKLAELEKKIKNSNDVFYSIDGVNVFTVIVSEKHEADFSSLFGKSVIKSSKNLAMITLRNPEEMEVTPGVVSFLYSVFGEHGINIVETMSCWTDTIFVISEKDVPQAMQFLKF